MQKYIIFQYSNVAHSNLLNMKCAAYWRTRISFLFIVILHYFFNGNWYRKKKISFCLWNDNFASCIKIEMKIRVLLSAEVLFAFLLHCVSFYYYYYVNVGFVLFLDVMLSDQYTYLNLVVNSFTWVIWYRTLVPSYRGTILSRTRSSPNYLHWYYSGQDSKLHTVYKINLVRSPNKD